jgi:hypothetical protein
MWESFIIKGSAEVKQLEKEVFALMPERVDFLLAAEERLRAFRDNRKPVSCGWSTLHKGSQGDCATQRRRLLSEIQQLTPNRSARVRELQAEADELTNRKVKFAPGDREERIEIVLADIDSLLIEFGYRRAGSKIESPTPVLYERGVKEITDFEFVQELLEQVGESKFTQLVCNTGCTPRDAQNLLGALQRSCDGVRATDTQAEVLLRDYESDGDRFDKFSDKRVVEMLREHKAEAENEIACAGVEHDKMPVATDFEFISRLIAQVGKQEFVELVCASGGTTRDSQNLIGALQYGASGFDSHADAAVIKRLGDLDV